jgi:hypothetical protein
VKLPGINIQAPWSSLIIDGRKTIETRFYPIPKQYVGVPIAIIETPGKNKSLVSRVVGVAIFGESFAYVDADQFYSDSPRHLVSRQSSDFGWEESKQKHGWPILTCVRHTVPLPGGLKRGIVFTKEIEVEGFLPDFFAPDLMNSGSTRSYGSGIHEDIPKCLHESDHQQTETSS